MSNDCVDICGNIIEIMCMKCPNYSKCQNLEDDANHDQMVKCVGYLKMTEYPLTFIDNDGISHTRKLE